ncbi:hypothetical protein F444_14455 [Plasmopara halstedii]|uniref:Uncharacterized protein n=1 Tax=Plasmopara halstedii TaxID=4781 RepID=A0A0P1B511_PLAHL|nr:hypothetical protein F444_14455 [Plasmopara halstedii]CEG48545.1 hypothetical protein F444_14455 [Plasmopara halstedii]|eukprot:XP_024584914.1 hypothetical protein F444_14455 [Plasmopara halstedii]
MVHLSPATEVAIRLLPGNDRCVDCKAIYPQWAGVSFGVLLCLDCAGKHRSLGVQTSFVKSLVMDSWSESEVRSLEVGGNAKWIAVCTGIGIYDSPMEKKYSSSVAKAYKYQVALAAAKDPSCECTLKATSFLVMLRDTVTFNDIKSISKKDSIPSPTMTTDMSQTSDPLDGECVKCTTCCSMISLNQLNGHSKSCSVSTSENLNWRKYERKFGAPDEPLGFTLVKSTNNFAEVSRIIPGGAAEQADVIVGSLLIGLNNTKNLNFDDVVDMLRSLPRPLTFHFVFRSHVAPESQTIISSIPEPRTVEIKVTLHEKEELGCSLSTNVNCFVRSVDEDSIAKNHGILVGSRVVAVNGQKFLKPKELIHAICTAQRPIEITVHRVEGLMRGWSK